MNGTGCDDVELVRRFVVDGDQSAFAALVQRHRPRIRRMLWALLQGNLADIDDVEQEIYIGLYRGLYRFRGDASFTTFLYRFTRNRGIDLLRRAERERRKTAAVAAPPAAADPQEAVAAQSQEQLAMNAVAALPRADRELMVMRESEQLSIAAIAEITGLKAGTIKSRLHRLRRELARRLRAQGVEL